MRKELFIKKHVNKGIKVLDSDPFFNPPHTPDTINAFRKMKEFTGYINFDCQIKETGGCKVSPYALKCCCHDCLFSVGYFRHMIDKDLGYYARHFSDNTGFWRKGKGCILSRKMRSVTCLTHHCNYQRKGFQGFSHGINVIRDELYRLRKEIWNDY